MQPIPTTPYALHPLIASDYRTRIEEIAGICLEIEDLYWFEDVMVNIRAQAEHYGGMPCEQQINALFAQELDARLPNDDPNSEHDRQEWLRKYQNEDPVAVLVRLRANHPTRRQRILEAVMFAPDEEANETPLRTPSRP